MAISQYPAASWESNRRNRNCLPEIAPQGHFLALRAQGATAPLGPRNDKLEGLAPQNACRKDCQPARRSLSAATDAIGAHHFNGGLYELQVPSRDCHVGLRPPRNDKSGGIVRSAKPLYNLPARKALTERRYRRNRFSRFYRQPVRIGSIAPGGVCPSPTIIYDFPYSLSYGCISRNSPGVRPVSLRNALAKAVEDGKPHSAEMCRTVSSVPRSRTLAFASRRRTMRA